MNNPTHKEALGRLGVEFNEAITHNVNRPLIHHDRWADLLEALLQAVASELETQAKAYGGCTNCRLCPEHRHGVE